MPEEESSIKSIAIVVCVLGAFLGSGFLGATAKVTANTNTEKLKEVTEKMVTKDQFNEYKDSQTLQHNAIMKKLDKILDEM